MIEEVHVNLLLGTLALSLAAVIYGLTLIMVRNPVSPRWAQGYVPVSMFVMAIISLGSTGLILASRAFAAGGFPGLEEGLLSLAAVPVTVLILWLMRIKQRLARYAAMESAARTSATVIDLPGPPAGPAEPEQTGGGRLAA